MAALNTMPLQRQTGKQQQRHLGACGCGTMLRERGAGEDVSEGAMPGCTISGPPPLAAGGILGHHAAWPASQAMHRSAQGLDIGCLAVPGAGLAGAWCRWQCALPAGFGPGEACPDPPGAQ